MIIKYSEFLNEKYNILTDDEKFKKWFGDSVMVDKSDNPKIFYHGSKYTFDVFDKSKIGSNTDNGWLGKGFYFYTNKYDASQYGEVSEYYLKLENPYFATDKENIYLSNMNSSEISNEFTEKLIDDGFDGIYYNGDLRGETVVFEPTQIWKIKKSQSAL